MGTVRPNIHRWGRGEGGRLDMRHGRQHRGHNLRADTQMPGDRKPAEEELGLLLRSVEARG